MQGIRLDSAPTSLDLGQQQVTQGIQCLPKALFLMNTQVEKALMGKITLQEFCH
jgi:hypothetical protein